MESLSKRVDSSPKPATSITVKPGLNQRRHKRLQIGLLLSAFTFIGSLAAQAAYRNMWLAVLGSAGAMIILITAIMLEKRHAWKFETDEPDVPYFPTEFPPPDSKGIECVFLAEKNHFILNATWGTFANVKHAFLTCKKIPSGIKYTQIITNSDMSFVQLEPDRADSFGRAYHRALCRDVYRNAIQVVTLVLTFSDGGTMILNNIEITKSA